MSEVNKEELRRLANEATETEMEWPDATVFGRVITEDWADYASAANPATVLALLDELEEAHAETLEEARLNGMGSEREAALMAERDALRAEVEALRKDAARWKCVRNAIPMRSPYAVWREGSHVVLGKDADELVDNFLLQAQGERQDG